jgi:hypothetical protein
VREPGLAPEAADVERRLEQVPDAREALVLARRLEVDRNPVEDLLRRREVPGRLEDEEPVLGGPEDVQLPERADVVDARVRPCVRELDETLLEPHREAVRHGRRV